LAQCHTYIKKTDGRGRPRRRRLRFHLFEAIARKRHYHHSDFLPGESKSQTTERDGNPNTPYFVGASASGEQNKEYSMKEAMALLEGREYVPNKPTIWQRLHKLESKTHSPSSIYAMKVAGAALVFGTLLWAEGYRAFFIKYNITGSLLTIVVAL
jgi:hypothetical protein